MPPGKAPNLHRKWVGPYYIILIGPNHSYRFTNAQTNQEVYSLINSARLKSYYDSDERPTNPPDELTDHEAELDQEEINPHGAEMAQNQETMQVEESKRPYPPTQTKHKSITLSRTNMPKGPHIQNQQKK